MNDPGYPDLPPGKDFHIPQPFRSKKFFCALMCYDRDTLLQFINDNTWDHTGMSAEDYFDGSHEGSGPALTLNCKCGFSVAYAEPKHIPSEDVKCICGDPNCHALIYTYNKAQGS